MKLVYFLDLRCPEDVPVSSDDMTSCYKLLRTNQSRNEANLTCSSYQSSLVSIQSQEEQDFIAALIWRENMGE